MAGSDVRKGMSSPELTRDEFQPRFNARFIDPAFRPVEGDLRPALYRRRSLGRIRETSRGASDLVRPVSLARAAHRRFIAERTHLRR